MTVPQTVSGPFRHHSASVPIAAAGWMASCPPAKAVPVLVVAPKHYMLLLGGWRRARLPRLCRSWWLHPSTTCMLTVCPCFEPLPGCGVHAGQEA
mgnify:CR=1